MTEETKVPAAPRGLQVRGRALWRAVLADFELRADERVVLTAACRTADELDRLETELATAEVMVEGSTGQMRVNPLFTEVRQHRKVLGTLLRQLGLVEDEEDEGKVVPLHVTAMKRAAANMRWSRVRAERGDQ